MGESRDVMREPHAKEDASARDGKRKGELSFSSAPRGFPARLLARSLARAPSRLASFAIIGDLARRLGFSSNLKRERFVPR